MGGDIEERCFVSFIQAAQREASTYLVLNGLANRDQFQHLKKKETRETWVCVGGGDWQWW